MAKARRAIRVVATISMLSSILTIIVTSWTLGSLVSQHMMQNGSQILENDSSDLTISGNRNATESTRSRLWIQFGEMTDNFRAMVLGCVWMATIFGMVQLCASIPLVLGSSRVLVLFPKYAVGINFICIIFTLGCLSIPLTYNRDCHSELDYICTRELSISQLSRKVTDALANFPPKTLNLFWWDLTAFYTFMGIDIFILLFNVIFLMFALRFGSEFASF